MPGDDTWRTPGDPAYDAHLAERYALATDVLSANGALVVWLTSPHIETHRGIATAPQGGWSESDPNRIDRVNELIAESIEGDDRATLVDYAGHLAGYPGGELDPAVRPDGIHLSTDPDANATDQVGAWLGPELLATYGAWATDRWIADAVAGPPAPERSGSPTTAPSTTGGD
jgi:hypothetical protein